MRLHLKAILMLGAVSLLPGGSQALARPQAVDVLIKGGTIYDGSQDMKPYVGDVAIAGDKIVYVGPHADVAPKRVIDAKGLIVSPGFIDGHTHPKHFLGSTDPQLRRVGAWAMQGVSTILIGADGGGTPKVKAKFDKIKRLGSGVNIAAYVGFGAIRRQVIGLDDRAPTEAELAAEKQLVARGMCEGAIGLSTGLFYVPQSYAKTDEVIALAKEAAKRGGIYDTHQRDEGNASTGVVASTKEVLQIGKEAGLPVVFSHIKAMGRASWGKSVEVIKLINDARAAGQPVWANQYPWTAFSTYLHALLLPSWALDGGYPAFIKRLDDPASFNRIRSAMVEQLKEQGGPHTILFTGRNQPWSGKYLDEIAKDWKLDPVDAAIRIMRQTKGVLIVGFGMSHQDIVNFMTQPWTVTSSDGGDGHPRQYGTFPMKYQQFVKQHHIISMKFYIRHQTGLSADIFMLDHRGYLRPGYYADVVVFDPARYASRADYVNWDLPAKGVVELFVNGKAAVDNGKLTDALSGRPLPHTPVPGSCP